ncbi:cytochrome P450 [Mycena sp. CBHHK59/15]|nr:cytochrome P450 [Mycena sp. CBHHK59/15]
MVKYKDWAEQFGDVIYVEVFGSPMVILNSYKAVTELLERRSANYSDRPPMHMANSLMKWHWDLAHMRYSDWWRLHRKTFHQYFQPRAVPAYHPIQIKATRTLLLQLMQNPARFAHYIRQHAGNVILRIVYGYEIQPEDDSYVSLADEAMKGLTQAANTGTFLVDFLPILKYVPSWLPGAGFKRKAKEWAKSSLKLRDSPFEALKESIAAGTAIPCFAADNLEKLKQSETPSLAQEEVIKNCAGIATWLARTQYVNASHRGISPSIDSVQTVSVILTWILAMTLNPEIQANARAELDAVVGNRLPDFADRPSLPYVNAMLDETLRWGPVTPLALPHMNIIEDEYNGYYIPAGTTVVGNAYAILHDEVMFPEPQQFKPERFLPQQGKEPPLRPETVAFGFGRRVCPGRYLALNSAWIVIVSILKTYNIGKAVDASGREMDPNVAFTTGIVSHPKPFECSLTVRSSEALALIQSAISDDNT